MREKEIKILWGRSGNRCAICKLELTPDGDKETLGEMAHIVARADDGPRGESDLIKEERDNYKNLILLCPTHHSEIDKNHQDWPVHKLLKIKKDHEEWVSEQLSNGNINVFKIDNTSFLELRNNVWQELSRDHVAIVLSLTPLRISGDFLDTMSPKILDLLDNAYLQNRPHTKRVDSHHTRPSENGVVNERFPELPKRFGHSLHIFRSGHCEFFKELGHDIDRCTQISKEKNDDLLGAKYVIRYTEIAAIVDTAVEWLISLWDKILPFEYLDFRCKIFNCKNTTLYAYQDSWEEKVFGYPLKSGELQYSDILTKEHELDQLSFNVLKYISNCFGLILENKIDQRGDFERPTRLR